MQRSIPRQIDTQNKEEIMAKNSAIAWTDNTWNPWQGCRKVSPGCANCYMFRDKKRYGQNPLEVKRSAKATFNLPLRWKDPAKVFVCSWSDFFIEDADGWRDEAWEIMRRCPQLTFQILTKRPQNIKDRLPVDWGAGYKNVWLGITVENQEMAHARLPYLLSTPSVCRFVSVEPMLGPVHMVEAVGISALNLDMLGSVDIDWVICGGESGSNARKMNELWALELKHDAVGAGVPFFMKQMSGRTKTELQAIPAYLDVRQWPKICQEA